MVPTRSVTHRYRALVIIDPVVVYAMRVVSRGRSGVSKKEFWRGAFLLI